MTKQEIYEQIVQLTSELHAINIAENIFNAAKEGDSKKVEEVFETFKKEHKELYARIVRFGEKYNKIVDESSNGFEGEIFTSHEDKEQGNYIYDTNIIDNSSLFILMCFAKIDSFDLFGIVGEPSPSEKFVEAFKKSNYPEMEELVRFFSWEYLIGKAKDQFANWYELLIKVFKGEFCLGF